MNDLIANLSALSGQTEGWLWSAFLVFCRVGAVMALMPGFGEQLVPARIRLVLTLAFTTVIAPAILPQIRSFDGALLLPIGVEVAAGLALGLGLRLFIMALQMAGMMNRNRPSATCWSPPASHSRWCPVCTSAQPSC